MLHLAHGALKSFDGRMNQMNAQIAGINHPTPTYRLLMSSLGTYTAVFQLVCGTWGGVVAICEACTLRDAEIATLAPERQVVA